MSPTHDGFVVQLTLHIFYYKNRIRVDLLLSILSSSMPDSMFCKPVKLIYCMDNEMCQLPFRFLVFRKF